jgi:hypothetical protein
MNKLILVVALTVLSSAHAQTRGQQNLDLQIENAVSRINRTVFDRRAHEQLDEGSKRELLGFLRDASRLLRLPQEPVYTSGMHIRAFSDDRCVNLITEVKAQDNCSMLANVYGSRNVWSIAIEDQCFDISDRPFASSCENLRAVTLQPVISRPVITLYSDDRCVNQVIGVDPAVNYEALQPFLGGQKVWSMKVENQCLDISDRTFNGAQENALVQTALGMRGYPNGGEVIELFSDDRCVNSVTQVQRGNDCAGLSKFYGNLKVWSIKFRGRCEDISDTTFTPACNTYAR